MGKIAENDKPIPGQGSHSAKPVIFLHIPKTAGTTLHDIIERHYVPGEICTFGADAHAAVEDFKNLSSEERAKIHLLRGHMAFGLHRYLPGTNDYFTILRDPIDRVVSYYNFILRTPDHYLNQIVQSDNMSISDLLQSEMPLMMNDAQVRLLSGVWGGVAFGKVSTAMLGTAEQNLNEFFVVVGITEEFDKTLCLLGDKLNWGSDILYERQNVSQHGMTQRQLPAETVNLIRQANQMDFALYEYASSLFRQQVRQQGPSFPLRVILFQARNRWEPIYWRLRTYSIRASIRKKTKP